jgi:hypothetical protein
MGGPANGDGTFRAQSGEGEDCSPEATSGTMAAVEAFYGVATRMKEDWYAYRRP